MSSSTPIVTTYNTWCFKEVKLENVKKAFFISVLVCAVLVTLMVCLTSRSVDLPALNWTVAIGIIGSAVLCLNTFAILAHHYDVCPQIYYKIFPIHKN